MSIKVCREKLDKEQPNLPIMPNEKPKVIKTILSTSSSVKLKGSKTLSKVITKINKVNSFLYFSYYLRVWIIII